jgi:hypothetical protein
MWQIFKSIFGLATEPESPYPENLVEQAIERAVDATDPRLRLLGNYQERLRPAILHAIDHVVALVDGFPAVRDAAPQAFGQDPELTACFASPEHIREVFSADQALRDFLDAEAGDAPERVVALLVMQRNERNVLGIELTGEILRREVHQVTVSFAGHRLIDPAAAELVARRHLKRRAFDHLLALALHQLATARGERTELEQQYQLLQRKHEALEAGRWGFGEGAAGERPDPARLQAQIDDIETEMGSLTAVPDALEAHLEVVAGVLAGAERHIWSGTYPLIVDRSGVKREQPSHNAPELTLFELYNSNGASVTALMVTYPVDELPARKDWLREAERYLG